MEFIESISIIAGPFIRNYGGDRGAMFIPIKHRRIPLLLDLVVSVAIHLRANTIPTTAAHTLENVGRLPVNSKLSDF